MRQMQLQLCAVWLVQGALSAPVVAALQRLCSLFGLTTLLNSTGDLLEDSFINCQQAGLIRQQQYALLKELRPDAVALVDSFGFPDYLLNSCIGRSVRCGDVLCYTAFEAALHKHCPFCAASVCYVALC